MTEQIGRSLPPEVVSKIEAALSNLESTFPGVSTDPEVRGAVQAAVGAAISSLDRMVPEATEADTRRALEAYEPSALGGVAEALRGMAGAGRSSADATRRALEAYEPSALGGGG